MANIVSTFVKLVNLNEYSYSEFKKLFLTTEKNSTVDLEEHLSKLYDENFGEDGISINWMNENIGGKQFNVTFHDGYPDSYFTGGVFFQDEVEIYLENSWSLPEAYLKRLINYFTKIDSGIILYGTYVDEFYDPIGAFVYAKENYADIEELYPEVEIDQMDNDDYREKAYERLREHSISLYQGYLERLEEESSLNISIEDFTIELTLWDGSLLTEKKGKTFDPFIADMIQISINKVLKKHSNLGVTNDTFPLYFINSTLKLRINFFNNFETRKAIQAFLTLGTELPTNGVVSWNAVKTWGLPDNENAWEFDQIIELSKDFYLLINGINDGGSEKLGEIRWEVCNLITNEKDNYKIIVSIDKKIKEILANPSIGG